MTETRTPKQITAEATISTLTAERDALKRERDEARAALGDLRKTAYPPQFEIGSDRPFRAACAQADAVLARIGEPKDE